MSAGVSPQTPLGEQDLLAGFKWAASQQEGNGGEGKEGLGGRGEERGKGDEEGRGKGAVGGIAPLLLGDRRP